MAEVMAPAPVSTDAAAQDTGQTVDTGLICSTELTSVKQFMADNNLTQVKGVVGENTSGYPFVTFITADNKAHNIYFSIEASKVHAGGQEIKKGFFDHIRVRLTKNQAGEPRIKLCGIGESSGTGGSTRLDTADLF